MGPAVGPRRTRTDHSAMKPLSLALIRQRYAEDGGAERFVARLLQAMQGTEIRVTLVTRAWGGQASFDVLTVNPFYIGRTWRDWSFARAVRRLAAGAFDIVQSHERIAGCDVYRAGDGVHREWLRQRARVLGPFGRLRQRISPYHLYTRRAERRLFQSPKLRAVVCNSNMVKEDVKRNFGVPDERIHVIRTGVDTNDYHPNLKRYRLEVRTRLHIHDDSVVFLFVGSGFERKGLAAALDGLAEVPDAHLIVIGRDRRLEKFRRQAGRLGLIDRVHFERVQPDVRPYYGAADALVLPTLYDPFPNVILEAMASGLPVITSTKCGGAELIQDGVNGFVRDALDRPGLAAALDALHRPERRAAMSRAARASVESLNFSTMTEKLIALYRRLSSAQAIRSRE